MDRLCCVHNEKQEPERSFFRVGALWWGLGPVFYSIVACQYIENNLYYNVDSSNEVCSQCRNEIIKIHFFVYLTGAKPKTIITHTITTDIPYVVIWASFQQ